ncbi:MULTISPECIES: multidrug efflux RND transporter permease subunit [unclassified Pseudomonas]|uniref:multidrug efflux RND transporter permease subunit n=1 Tax=unclassified Pseudomonas TaxID=196821 RepID=UPI0018E72D33|nr:MULTISPECIES: multidrug efflux RND transporter permease subunit [unclassified Pseudomonas]MBJ2242043.1 multidrug efflux RND transporter permease subunit [Pseudomonas sp. MF6768]WLI33604.1 multidrug efflux RND transporter permease subunit [Pseudomonas sp. FP818]
MTFTDLFIRRPVLALVVSLLIVLLGWQAFGQLPLRQFPQMESALVTVTTVSPGASAETVQSYITQPLQKSLASAQGIDYMRSTSRQNVSIISIYGRVGADSDRLFTELLAKTNEVRNQLPRDIEDPVLNKVAADNTALMYLGFSSDTMNNAQITDVLLRVIQPRLVTLPGMAEAQIIGNQSFAMRIWLDPLKLAGFGLSASDVTQAIKRYNVQSIAGDATGELVVTSVTANTELQSAEGFRAITLKTNGDSQVRLGDVARVELGAQNYDSFSSFNGLPATYISIKPTPDANPLELGKRVRELMPLLQAQLPPHLQADIAYDSTLYINASIDHVLSSLLEAILIVVLVVFLFLGSLRAVVIPVITIPLSLVGTLFFMQLMGYSINVLTLLAMVLAIGLVVDDAIVMMENIHRHIERGKSPLEAAIKGAREVCVPVISMTITLAAVYAPIGFLQGLTGALFKEFALTLAGAVVISGIVALTLSPMMCALLLRPEEQPRGLSLVLDRLFNHLKQRYQRRLHQIMEAQSVVIVFALLILGLIPAMLTFTLSELAPDEDQGLIFILASAPQPSNLAYLNRYTQDFIALFKTLPEYQASFQINGLDGVHSGVGGFQLRPWDQRERTQMEVLAPLRKKLDSIPGLQVFAFNLPSLPGTGEGLPFGFVISSQQDHKSMLAVAERVKQRAIDSGKFAYVDIDLAFDRPEVVIDIDRAKAAQMGVSMQDLSLTLATLLAETEINRFRIDGNLYKVIAQVERTYRDNPDWLSHYNVKNAKGQLLPLSTLITVSSQQVRPRQLNQFQQLNSVLVSAYPIVGMSNALETVHAIAQEEAPAGYTFDYSNATRQFVQEGNALWGTFGLALAIIGLVLAAQFESLRDPLVILVTVPLSICGALIALFLGWSTLNIYTQIGLVTLIGLISKHGILIVEFANQLRKEQGLSARAAIEEAAAIRLRPVLMTTIATVLGVIPLVFSSGAGAVSRFDIGMVIATGMSIGTLFTLFVLPSVYTALAKRDMPAP